MKFSKKIILLTGMIFPVATQAVIYHAGVWDDPETGHVVACLGDVHRPDKQSCYQQYEVINNVLKLSQAHLIVEDKWSKHLIRASLPIYVSHHKGQFLARLHLWSKAAGIESTNVEFRHCNDSEKVFLKNWRLLRQYKKLKEYSNDFSAYNDKVLKQFVSNDLLWLQKRRLSPFSMGFHDTLVNDVRKGFGLETQSYNFSEDDLLDLEILNEISKDRQMARPSVVAAGGWHTRNIENVLADAGYMCQFHERREPVPYTMKSFLSYNVGIKPIELDRVFALPENLCSKKVDQAAQSKFIVSLMRYRGLIEKGHLGQVNRLLTLGVKLAGLAVIGYNTPKVVIPLLDMGIKIKNMQS